MRYRQRVRSKRSQSRSSNSMGLSQNLDGELNHDPTFRYDSEQVMETISSAHGAAGQVGTSPEMTMKHHSVRASS